MSDFVTEWQFLVKSVVTTCNSGGITRKISLGKRL